MSHICEFCKHEFGQKNDLTRHLKKKNGCIPIEKIIEKTVVIEVEKIVEKPFEKIVI